MGWKGELGQQRTAQNTRCQRLALFFPPRGGRYNFSVPAANAEARVWPGRGTGRRGAPRSPQQKTPAAAKGSRKRMNETESAPRSPNKKPRRMGGVLFAKESYYLVVMNTPGPMVELKEMLFT